MIEKSFFYGDNMARAYLIWKDLTLSSIEVQTFENNYFQLILSRILISERLSPKRLNLITDLMITSKYSCTRSAKEHSPV